MSEKSKIPFMQKLNLTGIWENMSPNHRRVAVIVGVVLGLILVMALVSDDGEKKPSSSKRRENTKRSILTNTNTREIGIDALNAKVKKANQDIAAMNKKNNRLEQEVKDLKKRRGNDPDMTQELQKLKTQLKHLKDRAKTIGWDVDDIKEGYINVPGTGNPSAEEKTPNSNKAAAKAIPTKAEPAPVVIEKRESRVEEGLNSDPNYYFRTKPIVRPVSSTPSSGAPNITDGVDTVDGLKIRTFRQERKAESEDSKKLVYLPPGTIVSTITLNGLDALTGQGARKDPFPVVARVSQNAILPNLMQADIRECLVILAGYGDLSSERAYLRGEAFSCITKDGDVIESDFPSYAVGEDGKAGIRGRLVEKTGALIANTVWAGAASGFSQAFGTSPVPVIQTGDVGNNKGYQNNFSQDAARHGIATGASNSFERLADYYMNLADQIYPVVEVDAGRKVDVVLTSGILLKPRTPGDIAKAKKQIKKKKKG